MTPRKSKQTVELPTNQPGLKGRIMRGDVPSQIFRDMQRGVLHRLKPGDFVPEELIKRFNIDPRLFVHPDSMRVRGAFEFAHKNKGKFSVAIIRDMNGRGDVLMASVIAKALKQRYEGDVSVWFCVQAGYQDILQGNPYVDRVYTDRKFMMKQQPDVHVNVNDMEFRTELKDFEKTQTVVRNRASIYLEQLELFLENKTPYYSPTDQERKWAKKELKRGGYQKGAPIVGLQMYGSNPTRTYPHMLRVESLLKKKGYQTFKLDLKIEIGVYAYSFREIGALIEQMFCVVTPNSAFYHLAGAMKQKAVSVFGSCDGDIWTQDYEKVIPVEIGCPIGKSNKCWWSMPCIPGDSLREKEKTKAPDCLELVKPEKVIEAVEQHKKVKKILVVVLTWNFLGLTKQMIDSIRSLHDYDILVIDNNSTDGTVEWCKTQGIRVIKKKCDVDEAWNIGLQQTYNKGYDYCLLCNNDCILSAGYIDTVVEVAERRLAFTVTGNVINKHEASQADYNKMIANVEANNIVMSPGDYSALLISRECIEVIGGFDHFAPRYQADEDHMLRIRLFGRSAIKTYATTFYHKHGAVVRNAPEFNQERRQKEWKQGVRAFKKKWKIDLYGRTRKDLNSLKLIKERNRTWKSKINIKLHLKEK